MMLTWMYLGYFWKFSDIKEFLAAPSKMECEMTMITKSSAIEWLRWIYQCQVQETVPNIDCSVAVFEVHNFLLLLQREASQN